MRKLLRSAAGTPWEILAFKGGYDGLVGLNPVPDADRNELLLYFTDRSTSGTRWWAC